MIEKNIVGTYNRKDVYPEFGYEDDSEASVDAVAPVGGTDAVQRVIGVGLQTDPVEQWRAFSEKLRDRRLAFQEAQARLDSSPDGMPPGMPADEAGMNQAAAAYAAQDRAASQSRREASQDQQFQEDYEQDMLDIESQHDPAVLGLQRYLSTVNHPIPDEHLKAYELAEDEQEEAQVGDPGSLCVADVMTRKVVCVLESTSIEQVASLCNRRGFSGVPVVDQQRSLVGIVTLSDIMRQLLSSKSLSTYSEQGGAVLEQKALAILDEPVRNYMHREVVTVTPETSVREACNLMMKHGIRRVVVVRGNLVRGVFSARDAVGVLASSDLRFED